MSEFWRRPRSQTDPVNGLEIDAVVCLLTDRARAMSPPIIPADSARQPGLYGWWSDSFGRSVLGAEIGGRPAAALVCRAGGGYALAMWHRLRGDAVEPDTRPAHPRECPVFDVPPHDLVALDVAAPPGVLTTVADW